MLRAFKTKAFQRWLRKVGLSDEVLCQAITEMAQGQIDADLGGHVVKKRVALPGRGKRAGARTLVATNRSNRCFFIFGFVKSERDNIDPDELRALQEIAKTLLSLQLKQLADAVENGILFEIDHGH